MKTINIKTIRTDGGTQSRVEINNEIVTEYAQAIQAGAEFPPVVVFNDGVDNWLADGFHRFHAHNQAGKASIAVDMRQGTLRDAKLFSFGANGRHGQRPNNTDKRKSVSEMLADSEWAKWSQEKIAKTCEVSIGLVSKMVHELASLHGEEIKPSTRTVERNGKTYEQNTANIGKLPAKSWDGVDRTPAAAPALSVVPQSDEYTPLDEAQDQIQELRSMLAVANMGEVTPEDKDQAQSLIAELQEENRALRGILKAVTIARDTLMNELVMVKRQCVSLQAKIKKAA